MKIIIEDGFLGRGECDRIIALTSGATCVGAPGRGIRYQLPEDDAVTELRLRTAAAAGVRRLRTRPARVRRYDRGESLAAHSDRGSVDDVPLVATALVCLHSPDAGGRTFFPDADFSVEAKAGRLTIWFSPAAHESLAVQGGTKIVLVDYIYGEPSWRS